MLGYCWVNNLPSFIILRDFRLKKNMRGHMDTRDILGLEGRPLWSRLAYPLSNPIEKSILEELV
jgi:hypothetical protein